MNTLAQLFDWLLAASLRASLLALAVLVIQAALHRHLGARMRYALWLPVLIVLLMPVLPQSRWSIERVFQTPPTPAQIIPAPITLAMEPQDVVLEAAAPTPAPIDWQRVLPLCWICVSAGLLFFGSLSFLLTLRRFEKGSHAASDELLAALSQIAAEARLRRVPRVLIASAVSSPAVAGLLRPTLLLPAQFDREFTPSEIRLVLKHELMHLKRGDLPLNALLCVLMALHWFNPLLWIAFFKARADREAACDAQVLHNAPNDHRIAYGHALLKVETAFSPRGFSLGLVGIFQRGAALRSRIRSIAAQRVPHPAMKALVTMCILLMTFLGGTRAAPDEKSASIISIEARFFELTLTEDQPAKADSLLAEALTGIAGIQSHDGPVKVLLDETQNQALIQKLSQRKGTDLLAAPRLIVRPGQRASMEITHEFALPPDKKPSGQKVGVMLDVLPTLTDTDSLELAMTPRVVEFEGFVKAANGEQKPTFSERKADARTKLKTGQTALLDLGTKNDSQAIEDRKDGKVVASTKHSTRHMFVFVTARLVDNATGDSTQAAPTTEAIQAKLDKIIIPHMQFQGATVDECIEYLRVKANDLDITGPAPRGINIQYRPGSPPSSAAITLDLKEIPLGEALRYVVELAGLKMLVQPDAVLIGSAEDAQFAKSEAAPPVINPPDKLGEIVITARETSFDPSTETCTAKGDARYEVADMSIQAAELVSDRKAHQLRIRGPFTIIADNTKHSSTSSESSAVLDLATGKLTTSGPHSTEILTPPGSRIIIPSVEFRDATLTECIDFMRNKSRELDPDKKDVNIVVKPGGDASIRITLSLKNVPLSEALRYCAELANRKLTFGDQSYFLTPVSTEAPANKDQASSPPTQSSTSTAEAKATNLRKAPPQQYDFTRAKLGDVLQILTTDAGLNFFSLPPDDNPINQKLVTFSIRGSPFRVLETLCWANGLKVVFDQDRWCIRTANDADLFMQTYRLPKTRAGIETILKDISSVLGGFETKPTADTPQPSVIFKENEHYFYVKATRLQHTWVAAYFLGLSSSAQSGKTK